MGAAASLNEEQQLRVYEQMRSYLESKDGDQLPESQRELYEDMRSKFKHFAHDVRHEDLARSAAEAHAKEPTRHKYFLNIDNGASKEGTAGLLVGDIVRVHDTGGDIGGAGAGMWYEGLLVGIDERADAYTVDLEDNQVIVGHRDIQRVLPWHCMEAGDSVECRPDGQELWFAGCIRSVDPHTGLYAVLIDGDDTPETLRADQIRKLHSVRSKAARRWRKAMMVIAGMHRLSPTNKMPSRSSWDSSVPIESGDGGDGFDADCTA